MGARNSGIAIMCLAAVLAACFVVRAAARPEWTERSTWIWNGDLYVVGVATHARSVEDGRNKALEQAKLEIRNFRQGLSIYGVTIYSERTVEETQDDGSISVWRLFRVSLDDIEEHSPDKWRRKKK